LKNRRKLKNVNVAIKQFTPEVFKSPSIQKLGVVYAETRRDPSKPLELLDGNLSVQEYAGAIPLVLTEKNRLHGFLAG
jgi:hypothetical protein